MGFEDGFCSYQPYCYTAAATASSASFRIVTTPVHSGSYAAAFTVVGEAQARCFREGELPQQAYYGAWYYVPEFAKNLGNWNLIHFQGGNELGPGKPLSAMWDISLMERVSGGLRLAVFDRINDNQPDMSGAPVIPIGSWFHIEAFLKRASDATGEFSVSQDGVELLRLTHQVTDIYKYAQWYIGNLATNLSPSESTVYVDDVSVGASPE